MLNRIKFYPFVHLARPMVVLLLVLSTIPGYTQDKVQYDSIPVRGGRYFIVNDSSIYVQKDTVFYLPDSVDYYQSRRSAPEKDDDFYDNVGEKLRKNRVTREIHNLFFAVREDEYDRARRMRASEDQYARYEGRVIGRIIVRDLAVFGTNIEDTTVQSSSKLIRRMNRWHISTRPQVIKKNLLFHEGEVLHPSEIADNERVIRTLPFIKDARIHVIENGRNDNTVDLLVLTKDVFPLRFDIDPRILSNTRFGISHINLLGMGHELDTRWVIDDPHDGSFGYDLYYRMPNVLGHLISGEVNQSYNFRKEGIGFRAFRDFITPDIKYAGGAAINIFRRRELRLANGQLVRNPGELELNSGTIFSFQEFEQDLWLGRAYRTSLTLPWASQKQRLRMLFAARVNNIRFIDRTNVDENTNQRFHHRTRFLGSMGFSSRGYFKDKLVKAFGRTEDIPAGGLIQFTGGYELNEFGNRIYTGVLLSRGGFYRDFGYLRGELQWGGFFRDGRYEQGVVQTTVNYFTHLYTLNLFKIRQFVDFNYTIGIRRFDQELLDINEENGLRGFESAFLAGTQRLSLKSETVVFTPLYLASFRVAVYGFLDLGFLSFNDSSPFSSGLYTSLGMGLRLRNDNLAFSTLQFRFAYIPRSPIDESNTNFSFSTQPVLGLKDFDLKEPEVLEFR